jgi:hypothetical protein
MPRASAAFTSEAVDGPSARRCAKRMKSSRASGQLQQRRVRRGATNADGKKNRRYSRDGFAFSHRITTNRPFFVRRRFPCVASATYWYTPDGISGSSGMS